jgi:hypothetical protein
MAKGKDRGDKIRKPSKGVKRNHDGRFMGIRIADPPVKPRDTTVREIRRAVAAVSRVKRHRLNVLVNVPFDDDYARLLDGPTAA